MKVWNGHRIETDRFMLHYGHAATETTGTIAVESAVDDDGRGYVMPRAGWALSATARLDVNSISGGFVQVVLTATPGGSLGPTPALLFDTAGTLQIQVARMIPPFRFAAEARLTVQMVITTTIEVADFVLSLEVELER